MYFNPEVVLKFGVSFIDLGSIRSLKGTVSFSQVLAAGIPQARTITSPIVTIDLHQVASLETGDWIRPMPVSGIPTLFVEAIDRTQYRAASKKETRQLTGCKGHA